MRCAICGKVIFPKFENYEYVKGGICDTSEVVYVHTKCYQQTVRRSYREVI